MKNKSVIPTAGVRRRRPLADELRIALAHIRFLRIVLGKPSGHTKKHA